MVVNTEREGEVHVPLDGFESRPVPVGPREETGILIRDTQSSTGGREVDTSAGGVRGLPDGDGPEVVPGPPRDVSDGYRRWTSRDVVRRPLLSPGSGQSVPVPVFSTSLRPFSDLKKHLPRLNRNGNDVRLVGSPQKWFCFVLAYSPVLGPNRDRVVVKTKSSSLTPF